MDKIQDLIYSSFFLFLFFFTESLLSDIRVTEGGKDYLMRTKYFQDDNSTFIFQVLSS